MPLEHVRLTSDKPALVYDDQLNSCLDFTSELRDQPDRDMISQYTLQNGAIHVRQLFGAAYTCGSQGVGEAACIQCYGLQG